MSGTNITTIANVLTGVAVLEVKAPDTHRAEWSTEQFQSGSHSVKLSKPASSGYVSTYVELAPLPAAAALDIDNLVAAAGNWGWSHFRSPIAAYWEMTAFRFKDPLTEAFVDVTVQVDVMELGSNDWQLETITAGAGLAQCFYGGWTETAGYFGDFTAHDLDDGAGNTVASRINATIAGLGGLEANAGDWVLTLIRVQLYETGAERYVYIDDVILAGTLHTLEPGGSTPGMRLDSGFIEIGYTEDGVTMTYTADEADIEVEEETFPIDRVITKETAEVTCNMAESSLFNIDKAMAGSLLSGSILKLGDGTQKKITLGIRGTDPAGFTRQITIPSCTATGAVGMAYKKDEKTVVPVTFQALKTTGHPAVTMVDNAA